MSEAVDLVKLPKNLRDLLRVNRFYPFEESGKRLLFVVENAAFAEADASSWDLAQMLLSRPRHHRSELVAALAKAHGEVEAEAAVYTFEQLEILAPHDYPRVAGDVLPLVAKPLSSLVLHVAHDCNLRCGYCYADYGRYGEDFGLLTAEMARAHVMGFFDQLAPGQGVHLTFFGGEPLMNMPVVFEAHALAKRRAADEGRKIAFGITTNGTLLTDEWARFFEREAFTVTVSIDGPPDINDRLRPLAGGGGSYETIVERMRSTGLSAVARVTLTHQSTDVARIVRHLVGAGFREVGVSPVASGNSRFDLDATDLAAVLEGMRALSDDLVEWAKQGRIFPFSNLRHLVEQVAAGEPRPLPCGAATALAAADNKGDLYACHRLVGVSAFKIGNLTDGVNERRRFALIHEMHPRGREPCQTCWARYLCGGGCHHIAWLHSGKGAAPWQISNEFCDFLRDWYRLGLYTYARLVEEAPLVLSRLGGPRSACSQPLGL